MLHHFVAVYTVLCPLVMCVMCDFYISLHACVSKCYFPQFIFIILCCAFLVCFFIFFLHVGCFIIVILDLEVMMERENNLAILKETFSLPNLESDVMSENM